MQQLNFLYGEKNTSNKCPTEFSVTIISLAKWYHVQ